MSITPREVISTPDAPAAVGCYSQAIRRDGVLYCSGTIALDPSSGSLIDESRRAETARCLTNLQAVCRAAGTELGEALRLTIYTTRLECFEEINAAYAEFFADAPPARAMIGVASLPMGAAVEIDAVVGIG